jgi:hypothetical protein
MASLGEETGASYSTGGVKVTSIMAETDLERKLSMIKIFYEL